MVADHPSTTFSLKTCKQGLIVLAEVPWVTYKNALEISIDKAKIILRDKVTDRVLTDVVTPNDWLGCDIFREIWVSWENNILSLGEGHLIGAVDQLNYNLEEAGYMFLLSSYSFSSSNTSPQGATWEVPRKEVQSLFVETSRENGQNNLQVNENDHVVFGVRSCYDVKLSLSKKDGSIGEIIDINLSPSGRSSMAKNKLLLTSAETRGLFHCYMTTFIWIKWGNDFVEIGRGMETGNEIFMSTYDMFDIDLTLLSITSRTSPATWVMHSFEVNSFKLLAINNLPDESAYKINIQNRNTFVFRVRACKNAVLELKANPDSDGLRLDYVRMVIGDANNALTNIVYLDGDTGGKKDVDGETTTNILSCYSMRYLWISWKDSKFRLGTGYKVFENQLFEKTDKFAPRTYQFQWLHLVSLEEVDPITWQFDEYQGNAVILPTSFPDLGDVSQVSYSVEGRSSLVFKIRGDHDATLYLGHYFAFSFGSHYLIDIGTLKDDNSMYCSITRTNDTTKTETKTPNIISAKVPKYFWVSWYGGHIELGKGSVVGELAILSMAHKKMFEINAVHFTGGTHVEWTLNGIEVDRYSIHTSTADTDNSYEDNWLSTHLRIFPFMVHSPNPVSVVLTKTPFEDNNLEITFGILGNRYTSVWFIGDNTTYKQACSDKILDDTKLVPLWFLYNDKTLQVGSGDFRPDNIIIIYNMEKEYEWNGVILNNHSPAPVEWSILPETVNLVRKKTPATYGHRFLWRSLGLVSSLVFKARAGADAHILLSPAIEETVNDVIELTVGYNNNQMTIIRNGTKGTSGDILHSAKTPNVLSDQEYRTFWVSWLGGEIRLGKGDHVGVDPLIDWTLTDPLPIHAISMCTSSTEGNWEISEVVRDLYHISTPPKGDYTKFEYFTVYTGKPFLQFSVVTCTSARLLLLHSGALQDDNFEVVIGENMTDTAKLYMVRHLTQMEELAASTMPGVVTCGFEEIFWLSWERKMIRLGKGNYPSKVLFEYEYTDTVILQSIALGSGDDGRFKIPTLWQIRPNTVERLAYITVGPKNYNQFWGSSSSLNYLRFQLSSSGNVSIVISNSPQVVSIDDYEFTIHQEGVNDALTISKSGVQKTKKSVKSLHLWDEHRYLWVSWTGSEISLGVGLEVGSGAQITWVDEQPIDINFFSVASIETSSRATWWFYNAQGNVYEAYTPDTHDYPANYHRVWFAPVNYLTHFQLNVRACKNARIALISNPLDLSFETYQVILDTIDEPTGSKYSAIRAGINGTNMGINKDDGSVVSCNEVTDLWVDWDKGMKVGRNQWPGNEFMHYHPLIWAFRPNIIAMSTGPDSDGNWMFPFEQAEAVFVNISSNSRDTRGIKVYDYFWMGVHDRTSVVFSVRLEKYALVQLSQVAFQGGSAAYELEMDRLDGYTAIRGPDGIDLVKRSLPHLLSGAMYKAFWLTWDNDTLSFGAGGLPYTNTLLTTPIGSSTQFSTLGVASGSAMGGGEWSFLRSRGKVYRVMTEGGNSDPTTYLMVQREVITFQVRACSDAMLLLVGNKQTIFEDTLQISIGAYSNTKVEIRHVSRDDPVASGSFPNLLDCNALKSFWVSWKDGIIRVGSGTDLSRDLLSWVFRDAFLDDIHPFVINYLVPATPTGAGEWEFDFHQPKCLNQYTRLHSTADGRKSRCSSSASYTSTSLQDCMNLACESTSEVFQYRKEQCELLLCDRGLQGMQLVEEAAEGYDVYVSNKTDETYVAFTGTNYHYEQHWISVTGQMNITFEVRACSDVHLALVAIPGNTRTLAYEIVIGASANRKSRIRDKVGALVTAVVEENTPDILKCDTAQPFWVSWYNNYIWVGRGTVAGLEPFIRWEPDDPIHVINSVGLSTGGGSKGVWVFGNLDIDIPLEEKEDTYIIETGADKKYLTSFIPANNFLIFGVQACSDAFVSVDAVPNHPEVEAFVVGIGTNNNQEVSISATGSTAPPQTAPVKDVLSCNFSRTFWVEWGLDVVALGWYSENNPVGENPLIQYFQADMPEIHSVSIATTTAGRWEVSRSLAFYTQSTTQPAAEPTFSEFWVTMETTSELVFSVKACVEVHLKVGYDKYDAKNYYLVDIGTDFNIKSLIRDSNGNVLAETITSNILDCDSFRWFWVHWYQGLEVGTGRTPGASSILKTGVTYPVRALGFSTENGQEGQFRFDDIEDDSFYVVTPGDNTYQHAWILAQSTALTFKVRACTGAIIRLTDHFMDADPNKPSYEVVIDNGASMIRRLPGYTQLVNATTTKLVQCELFTELEVTWEGDDVVLRQDSRDVMRASDPNPIHVSALSFSAADTGNAPVAWKFPRHSGKDTVLITPKNSQNFDKWVTTSDTFIFFKLQAESDALIRACQFIGVMGFDCYDIGLQIVSPDTPTVCSSYIKSYTGGTVEASSDGCILNKAKSVQLWLSWQNDIVEVGLGSTVGYQTLMSWDASNNQYKHPVNAISMLTYKDKGYWEFSEVEDKVFEVKTLAAPGPHQLPSYTTKLRMEERHLNFKLKGGPTAVIILTETPDNLAGQRYEIQMGEAQTQVFKVSSTGMKLIMATVDTKGLLQRDIFKEYRVSWSAPWLDMQSLVLEEVLGDIKVEVDDEFSAWKVHAVSIVTGDSNLIYWSFKDNAAAAVAFETQGDKDSEQVVYKLSHTQHFQFKVKGKGPAHVILQEHYHTDNLYEFFIGIENNQKTAIKAATSTNYDVVTSTPDILSEVEFRQMWVSWTGHGVAIGYGYIHGVGQILYLASGNKPINAQYVALTTSLGNNGTWEVSQYPADLVMIGMGAANLANPLVSYKMVDGQTGALFEVKTCEGFSVSLHPKNTDPASYKIEAKYRVLSIYRQSTKVHTVTLSREVEVCYEYRRFYVGWVDGDIHLSGDAAGGWRYIEWEDNYPLEVHVVKVPEDGQVSRWLLPRYLGSAVEVRQAQPTGLHFPFQNVWYTLSGRTGLVFGVKSDTGGAVLFTRTPGIFTHDGYELRLANGNTTLHDRLTGEVVAWIENRGIVSSNENSYFWSAWDGGLLRIGYGVATGASQFFGYDMTPGYDIIAAAFDHNDDVTWTFDQDSGNEFIIETTDDTTFEHTWFALKENVFRFSVMSDQQAVVRMYVQPEYKEPHYTDLVFGTLDNVAFMLVENGNLSTAEIVPDHGTLDRDTYRPFWVVLEENILKVGSGHSLEGQFYQKMYTHRISTVSLGDDSVSKASWKIPQDQEVMARFRTPATKRFDTHWISLVGYSSATFRIQGCDSARILLVSVLKNQAQPSTLLVIDKAGVSYIVDVGGGNHSVSTPNLLSCDEPRAVWVAWDQSGVAFGSSATVGSNTLLQVSEPMHLVVAMGLASGIANKTTTATWDIFRLKGNVFYENVKPNTPQKGVTVAHPDGSLFDVMGQVRSCGGATVSLLPIASIEDTALNIVYGTEGNTMSEIIRGESSVAKASTPYYMNSMIDQPFWVSFNRSTVNTGLGITPPFTPLLTYKDPDTSSFPLMGFYAGQDSTCQAKWMVEIRPDDKLVLQSENTFSSDTTVISVMDAHVILLNIKAKHSAHIALHVIPGNRRFLTWEIVVQEYLSGKTCIREGVGGPQDNCVKKTNLLNGDEFRKFWIYWAGMTLSFGTGWIPSDETRVIYQTSNLRPPFGMVSFATYSNGNVAWEVFTSNTTYTESTSTSANPVTTPATTPTATTPTTTIPTPTTPTPSGGTGPDTPTTTTPEQAQTSTTSTQTTTTSGGEGGNNTGGLSAGAIVGIVFGSILGVGILVFVALLIVAWLKPNALPFKPPAQLFTNSAYSDIDGNTDDIVMSHTTALEYKDDVEEEVQA